MGSTNSLMSSMKAPTVEDDLLLVTSLLFQTSLRPRTPSLTSVVSSRTSWERLAKKEVVVWGRGGAERWFWGERQAEKGEVTSIIISLEWKLLDRLNGTSNMEVCKYWKCH